MLAVFPARTIPFRLTFAHSRVSARTQPHRGICEIRFRTLLTPSPTPCFPRGANPPSAVAVLAAESATHGRQFPPPLWPSRHILRRSKQQLMRRALEHVAARWRMLALTEHWLQQRRTCVVRYYPR